jgi:hypothetical protein
MYREDVGRVRGGRLADLEAEPLAARELGLDRPNPVGALGMGPRVVLE